MNRSAVDRDVDDEVQHYLDLTAAAHRAKGLPPDAALRAARIELGTVTGVREAVRSYGWENAIGTIVSDLRFAMRRLRAEPAFSGVALLTLALGIGGTTAIFSAVNPILFESLPYPRPDRLVALQESHANGARSDGTYGMYTELTRRAQSFEAIALAKPWLPTIVGSTEPERLAGQRVSAAYFRVLGVSPVAGRDFTVEDDRPNGTNVVIISHALWRRRFAGDRSIVGRQITLNDSPFTVVGVLPPDFENVLAPSAELWATLQYELSEGRAWGHHLRTIARLKAGVSVEQASREYESVGRTVLTELRPESYDPRTRFTALSLHDDVTAGVRRALLAILGAVALVLVIACVNVTNLLLARGVRRRGEFGLRVALGAARSRLVRQLLTESLLLSVLGGVLGIAVATVGVRFLLMLAPTDLPRTGAIGLNTSVFIFATAAAMACGVVFGLWPARQAIRKDPHAALQSGSRRMGGGHRRMRAGLVIAEVALALMLLVGSGLLLRSLQRLFSQDSGFDGTGVLTMQVQTAGQRFNDNEATNLFFSRVLDQVRQLPGVATAALTNQLPLSGDRDEFGVHFPAGASLPAASYGAFRYAVSPGYIETMRIPLKRGRTLDDRDGPGAPRAALISEALARRRFGNDDPIGQTLKIGPMESPTYTIVGIVGDVRQLSLALNEGDAVYTTAEQFLFADNAMSLVVRARGGDDVARLAPAIRSAVWSVDKDQPIVRIATMPDLLAASAGQRRFALILFEAFALAALVLSAAGIYGVLAGSVAERTRELGVRAALGATQARIVGLVLKEGLVLAACGVLAGLILAIAASQTMVSLLFGVSRLDPVTYGSVILLLTAVAAMACAVPAWRAARLDPASTLRAE